VKPLGLLDWQWGQEEGMAAAATQTKGQENPQSKPDSSTA